MQNSLQIILTTNFALITFSVDIFLSTFIIHLAAQFRILGQQAVTKASDFNFTFYDTKNAEKFEEYLKTLCSEMKLFVHKHNDIILYTETMESVFSSMLLSMFLCSSFGSCLCVYIVMVFFLSCSLLYYLLNDEITDIYLNCFRIVDRAAYWNCNCEFQYNGGSSSTVIYLHIHLL